MMAVIRGTVQYIDGLKVAITSVNEYFTGNFVGGGGKYFTCTFMGGGGKHFTCTFVGGGGKHFTCTFMGGGGKYFTGGRETLLVFYPRDIVLQVTLTTTLL